MKLNDTNLSHGYDAGNFANAYETEDLETALETEPAADAGDDVRAAFILGFFSSYALHEIPGSDRDAFDEAYFSDAGKRCVELGYCDDRAADYAASELLVGFNAERNRAKREGE